MQPSRSLRASTSAEPRSSNGFAVKRPPTPQTTSRHQRLVVLNMLVGNKHRGTGRGAATPTPCTPNPATSDTPHRVLAAFIGPLARLGRPIARRNFRLLQFWWVPSCGGVWLTGLHSVRAKANFFLPPAWTSRLSTADPGR